MSEFVLGIDLGTTNSCVAVHHEDQTVVIPDVSGFTILPSIVYVSNGDNYIIGRDAVEYLATHPANTIFGSKRLMGRQPDAEEVERIQQYFPYRVALGDNDELAVFVGDKQLDLVEISAMILGHVRENAKEYLGEDVTRAVISCPAYFTQRQREAVRTAGERAGFDILRVINEPTAAALAYRAGNRDDEKILIYDLGGGTFDVTVLELREKMYEVLATGGDSFLGGLDFDKVIRDRFRERFETETGTVLDDNPGALQRLMAAAEAAKIGAGRHEHHVVDLPYLTKSNDKLPKRLGFQTDVTCDELGEICNDLIQQTLIIADEVLIEAGLNASDIGEVVLVGGMTRFPPVRKQVAEHFGTQPHTDLNPDEVVAVGAAILGDALVHESKVLELADVIPVSIGCTINFGPYETVVYRNTRVPTSIEKHVPTTVDNQTGLQVRVYQGESANPSDNAYLGELTITDIPPRPAGEVEIILKFELDNEAILSLSAAETQTGQTLTSRFSTEKPVEVTRLQRELSGTIETTAAAPAPDPEPEPTPQPATEPDPEITAAPEMPEEIFDEPELVTEPEGPSEQERIDATVAQVRASVSHIQQQYAQAKKHLAETLQRTSLDATDDDVAQAAKAANATLNDLESAAQEVQTLFSDLEFAATSDEAMRTAARIEKVKERADAAFGKLDNAKTHIEDLLAGAKQRKEAEEQHQAQRQMAELQAVVRERKQKSDLLLQTLTQQSSQLQATANDLPAADETIADALVTWKQQLDKLEAQIPELDKAIDATTAATTMPAAEAAARQVDFVYNEIKPAVETLQDDATDLIAKMQDIIATQAKAQVQAHIDGAARDAAAAANQAIDTAAKASGMVEDLSTAIAQYDDSSERARTALEEAKQAAAKADAVAALAREASVNAQQSQSIDAAKSAAEQAQSARDATEKQRGAVAALVDAAISAARDAYEMRQAPSTAPESLDGASNELEDISELFDDTSEKTPPVAQVTTTDAPDFEEDDVLDLGEPEPTDKSAASIGRIELVRKPLDPDFEAQAPAPVEPEEKPQYRDLSKMFTVADADQQPPKDAGIETVIVQADDTSDAVDLGTPSSQESESADLLIFDDVTETAGHDNSQFIVSDDDLGKHLLKKKLVKETHLVKAVAYCEEHNQSFEDFAVAQGYLSPADKQNVEREQMFLEKNYDYKSFAETVIYMGTLAEDMVDEIEKKRALANLTVGQALVKLEHISQDDMDAQIEILQKRGQKKLHDLSLPEHLKKPSLVRIVVAIAARALEELVNMPVSTATAATLDGPAESDYVTVTAELSGDIRARFGISLDYPAAYIVATEMNPALGMIDYIEYHHIADEVVNLMKHISDRCVTHIKSKSSFDIQISDPVQHEKTVTDQTSGVAIDLGNKHGDTRLLWIER